MPVHGWTRVDAGTFHAFHTAWITHLSETLNGGVLPNGYYAMPEQHAGRRTLAIRHVSDHRIIALLEIVSPANKDRASHVAEFIDKAESALAHGIHLLLVDLFAPGAFDPSGMHGAPWEKFADESSPIFKDEPLTMASYLAGLLPEAYIERLSIGVSLPAMPLFLNPDRYVSVPLEETYMQAFHGLPAVWREVLEQSPL